MYSEYYFLTVTIGGVRSDELPVHKKGAHAF